MRLQDHCVVSFDVPGIEEGHTEIRGEFSGSNMNSLKSLIQNFGDMPDFAVALFTETGKQFLLKRGEV